MAAVLLGWLLVFDFPSGASPQLGVYVALIADIAVACGAGDFRVRTFFPEFPTASGARHSNHFLRARDGTGTCSDCGEQEYPSTP